MPLTRLFRNLLSQQALSLSPKPAASPHTSSWLRANCWFFPRHQLGSLEDVLQTPALQLGHGPRLFDFHEVAHASRVPLIMRIKLLVLGDHARVQRVRFLADHLHHDGLAHL